MIIYTGSSASPSKKISLRPDGLHALPLDADRRRLALWTKESDIRTPELTLSALQMPCCELTDRNTAVISSLTIFNGGPITLTEVGLSGDPLPAIHQFTIGDANSRWGASGKLKNGGVFFVHDRDLHDGFIHLDAAFLPFTAPALPGQANDWIKQSFSVPHNLGPMLPFDLTVAEGSDGLLWLFFTSDSMGTVARLRFRLGNVIELVDYEEAYIGRNSNGQPLPISINGETPMIVALPDAANGRILLGYQDAHHLVCNCNEQIQSANLVICAVYPDGRKELVTLLPWPSAHLLYPMTLPFPRPDGIYFIAPYYDTALCSGGWKTGKFDGQVRITSTTAGGRVRSYSEDGWFLFERPLPNDPIHNEYDLLKYRFRPALKISKSGPNVKLSWDEASSADQLQASADLKTWSNFGSYPALTPVTVPASSPHQFFRLLQKSV